MKRKLYSWATSAAVQVSLAASLSAQGDATEAPQGAARTFEDFLSTASADIPLVAFLINLVASALLALALGRIYIKFGKSLSNRRLFARNFLLLSVTVMLIITIVKSSLALSLGLVGALSIVRYRAAIKEPEELAYLFLAISIGLGMGADQFIITVVAFGAIVAMIWLRSLTSSEEVNPNLHLTLSTPQTSIDLPRIVETLERNCSSLDLKRFDEGEQGIEAAFLIQFDDYRKLEQARTDLRALDSSIAISFLDNKGLF